MSSVLTPIPDLIYLSGANSAGALTAGTASVRPSSFLQPTLLSWINAPYYNLPQQKFQNAVVPAESIAQEETQPEEELHVQPDNMQTTQFTLDRFDVEQLAAPLRDVAKESHISHVQTVIEFFQKGGEGARSFVQSLLNDINFQNTVLSSLITDEFNQFNRLHKELALRLAACCQARQVAHLILAQG